MNPDRVERLIDALVRIGDTAWQQVQATEQVAQAIKDHALALAKITEYVIANHHKPKADEATHSDAEEERKIIAALQRAERPLSILQILGCSQTRLRYEALGDLVRRMAEQGIITKVGHGSYAAKAGDSVPTEG